MSSHTEGAKIVSFTASPRDCAETRDFSIMAGTKETGATSYFLVNTGEIQSTKAPNRYQFPARHELLLPGKHGEPVDTDPIGKLVATFVATPSDGTEQGFRLLELLGAIGQPTGEFYVARGTELICVNLIDRSEFRFKAKLQVFLPCKVDIAA